VAIDVIGTLFGLERLREPLTALGAPGCCLELWFAQSLRDFFAASHAGGYVPLGQVLEASLPRTLRTLDVEAGPSARSEVMGTLTELEPAVGAVEACQTLAGADATLVALTNGSRELTRALLERSGLDELVTTVHSCDEVQTSKPSPRVYEMVERAPNGQTWLMAAHAWDVAGARRAGLLGAWVAAAEDVFLTAFPEPEVRAPTLADAARDVLAWERLG
jgi:2-haloacid dehalogenase